MSFSSIPTHIISDIFSKVSVDEIGRCRCVCKTWCDILTHPHFINLHLSKSPNCLMVSDSGPPHQVRTLNMIEVDDELDRHFVHHKPLKTWRGGLEQRVSLESSVSGLLCLWQFDDNDDTYIVNPILKQRAHLPKQKHVRKFQASVSYGFGLSPITKQYKVVRIFSGNVPRESDSEYVSECEIYTLGTNEWRNVGHVSNPGYGAKFVNGGLHYLTNDDLVFRFDLETESFSKLCSAPPPRNREAKWLTSFNELNGCLCVCDNSTGEELVIWVMKEYGVKESWTKEIVISIKNTVPEWVGYETIFPLRVFKDGSVLMLWRDDRLITYCPRTKVFEELDIGMSDFDRIYEVMNYVPSLLDLKNIGLEDVQVMVDTPIELDSKKYNFYGIPIESD